jgi:hypothetical protein
MSSISLIQKAKLSIPSLKQSSSHPARLERTSKVSTKSTSKIDEIYNSCEVLQKDLNLISARFVKETSESPLNSDFLKDCSTQKIRNEDYWQGIKRIQDRIKKKQEKVIPENIKNLVKVVNRRMMRQKTIVQHDDLVSENAVKFLKDNKRRFGTLDRSKSEVNWKADRRSKNKEIVINPDETVLEGFLDEASVFRSRPNYKNSNISLKTSKEAPLKLPKIQEKPSKIHNDSNQNHLQSRITFRKNTKHFNFT